MILILALIFIGARVEEIAHKKGFGSLAAYTYFLTFTLGTELFVGVLVFFLSNIWIAIGCAYLTFFFTCAAAPALIDFLPDQETPNRDDYDSFGRERFPGRKRKRRRAPAKLSMGVVLAIGGGVLFVGCLGLSGVGATVAWFKFNDKPLVAKPAPRDHDRFDDDDDFDARPRR